MDGETDVPPESASEEEHPPEHRTERTLEERLEACYAELAAVRTELAELRAHTHSEFAHATHEHDQYSSHDHKHEQPPDSDHTSEPVERDESGGGATTDAKPSATHWYFRPAREVIGRG